MNKRSSSDTLVPSPVQLNNEVHIYLSPSSLSRPGVYLMTFEDYLALNLQQRLMLYGYE